MIEELSIKGLGVIDEAVLRWGGGLTVLTGETGAGKTMVLTAIGLLLGEKADAALVREGSGGLEVEAVLSAVPPQVALRVEEAGGVLDGDELIVARTLGDQRARAFAGGRAVPAALLADIGERLVAVHGQSDQVHLRRPSTQRDALDRHIGGQHLDRLDEYRSAWDERRDVQARLADLATGAAERLARRDFLTRGTAEISEVAPQPGEDTGLMALIDRGQNTDDLRQAAEAASVALTGDDEGGAQSPGAIGALADARKALAAQPSNDELLALAERATEIATLTDALAQDLGTYLSQIDVDPVALEAALDRRGRLREVRRRWCDADPFADEAVATTLDHADAMLLWFGSAQGVIAAGDDDAVADALRERDRVLNDLLATLQTSITRARNEGARRLAAEVTAEVQALGMPGTSVAIAVEASAEPGRHGADDVSIGLVAHAGAQPVPLHRGASGGELSRVMLALEVVLAGSDPVPTFVFDEVDAGIGGEAALAVGHRLARLGRTAQVLVVTHLAQVAAFADHHFVVTKDPGGGITASDVREVSGRDRAAELARMLAGMSQSERGRAHADELLELAATMSAESTS